MGERGERHGVPSSPMESGGRRPAGAIKERRMETWVTCPTCGVPQLPGPTCKSCHAPLGQPAPESDPSGRGVSAEPTVSIPFPATGTDGRNAMTGEGSPPPPEELRLAFHGAGGSLLGIHIVNVLLTIVTLGVYYFWAKARVRRYLLSQTECAGDRFAYHGTGKELFVGFLKAVLLIGIPLLALEFVRDFLIHEFLVDVVAALLSYAIVLVCLACAIVGARRYRLSRTSWRGIRFSFRGRTVPFVKLFLSGTLLSLVTLGLYYPFFDTRRYGFLASHSFFGSARFGFDGHGRDLFGRFAVAILLTLPTLGLCWFWYLARAQRYCWDHTTFGPARFRSSVTGGRLLRLKLGNALLLVLTLGLGWPWTVVRNARFACAYLTVEGSPDWAAIRQEAQAVSTTGEGLAGILDAGFDFGA
jgi:uncharacterized membrane protein YjgN (DUF898 family)